MEKILVKAFAFIMVIISGFLLKKIKFFKEDDYRLVSRIVLNMTLPAAIISSFGKFEKGGSILLLVALGLGCNLMMIWLGYMASKKQDNKVRALYMLNFAGYNIGTFTLPFVQSFLGTTGVVTTCMFDVGNAISCTGGSYALTSAVISTSGEKFSAREFIKKLLCSVPFMSYMVMLTFVLLNIKIPALILSVSDIVGGANGFMSMLMIGLMFKIEFKFDYISKAGIILLARYSASAVMSFIIYKFFPLPLEVRQVLVILLFSPISAMASVYTERCEGDIGIASFSSSISILISIGIITGLLVFMGIGV